MNGNQCSFCIQQRPGKITEDEDKAKVGVKPLREIGQWRLIQFRNKYKANFESPRKVNRQNQVNRLLKVTRSQIHCCID